MSRLNARSLLFFTAVVIVAGYGCGAVRAQTFEELYRQGQEARAEGDFTTAIDRLERSVALAPDHVEALFYLGLVYGFESRFGEARRTLERARALDPANNDVRLGLARIAAFEGSYDEAAKEIGELLAIEPGNVEAINLDARVEYYRGDLSRAEARFLAALELAPNNLETLIGLGDVKAALGETRAAQAYYRRAAALDPDSPEVQARQDRNLPRRVPYRLDSTVVYSKFSRQPRKSWRETFHQLGYAVSKATTIHGRIEISERFGTHDTYLQAGIDHRFSALLSGYAHAGLTPSPDFRERWAALAGGTIRVWRGGDFAGPLIGTLDAKQARYDTGTVTTVSPGAEVYFDRGRISLAGRWINTIDETDRRQQGWLSRIDWRPNDTVSFFIGAARAPENQENVTIETESRFGGISVDVAGARIGLALAREDRENSYVRNAYSLTITFRF